MEDIGGIDSSKEESMNESCRLYLITPSVFELPAFAVELADAMSGGDVACVQLRMKPEVILNKVKDLKQQEIFRYTQNDRIKAAAETLMPIVHKHGAQFIINDYPEIAVEVGADGVHVGDEDMSAAQARAVIGEGKVVGVSCYASKDRAYEAGEQGADYVAFGQFYATKTKPAKGHPELDLLEFWRDYATIPSVAIGGIKPDNCAPLVQAGADFIAVVTGVWEHPDGAKAAVRAYNEAIKQGQRT